jgi:hypothetical protein
MAFSCLPKLFIEKADKSNRFADKTMIPPSEAINLVP